MTGGIIKDLPLTRNSRSVRKLFFDYLGKNVPRRVMDMLLQVIRFTVNINKNQVARFLQTNKQKTQTHRVPPLHFLESFYMVIVINDC